MATDGVTCSILATELGNMMTGTAPTNKVTALELVYALGTTDNITVFDLSGTSWSCDSVAGNCTVSVSGTNSSTTDTMTIQMYYFTAGSSTSPAISLVSGTTSGDCIFKRTGLSLSVNPNSNYTLDSTVELGLDTTNATVSSNWSSTMKLKLLQYILGVSTYDSTQIVPNFADLKDSSGTVVQSNVSVTASLTDIDGDSVNEVVYQISFTPSADITVSSVDWKYCSDVSTCTTLFSTTYSSAVTFTGGVQNSITIYFDLPAT